MTAATAWFPCYAGDILSSIRWKRMTLAQRGAYWQLICWQMQSPDGHLDNDIGALSAMADLDLATGHDIIVDAFPIQANGRRANERALVEWHKRSSLSEIRSNASAKRWHKENNCNANACDLHTQLQPQLQPQSESQPVSTSAGAIAPIDPPKPVEKPTQKSKTFKTWTLVEFTADVERANSDGTLSADEAKDFISYWTEPTATGRFRLATEQTWDTHRRMLTAVRVVYANRRVNVQQLNRVSIAPQAKPPTVWELTERKKALIGVIESYISKYSLEYEEGQMKCPKAWQKVKDMRAELKAIELQIAGVKS